MAASIAALIDSLPNHDDKIEVLSDLNTVLGTVPQSSVERIVANVSFNCVFDCLSTDNREQIELCCDVLKKLLTPLPPAVLLTQFQEEFHTGLTHDEPAVRRLCLAQLQRFGSDGVSVLVQYETILQQVVHTLADDKLDVANTAGKIISMIGSSMDGLAVLYEGNVMSMLQDVLSCNDTVRFRLYEVLIHICTYWPEGLASTAQSGLLQHFLNELHKDDILLQLNCIELLSDLASTEHGLLYLDKHDIIDKLENKLRNSNTDPLTSFLIPGLVKFFGSVARLHPKEVLSSNEVFVCTVFNSLSSPESENLHRLAIQTVGLIGTSIEGKLALEKLGSRMDTGVQCIGKALKETKQELKIIVLQALNTLLMLQVSEQTSELLKLTQYWFAHLGPRTFDYILTLAEQPFPDLRCAVLSMFKTLVPQPWAQNMMNEFPGFREYLLDRSTETFKEGKEAKFEVISLLANSPTATEIFGPPYIVQLKAYCSQGAFYIRAQAEVAMEGDS